MSEETKSTLKKYINTALLALVIIGAFYFVIGNIRATGNLLLVALGFGAVIIVHEFGHFIVAKLSDIKVEAFSIGFPPVLLAIQRTEAGLRFLFLPGPVEDKQEQKPTSPENADTEQSQVSRRTGLFSFTIGKGTTAGETEYRIGLLPFGGFVKMLGQDDTGPDEKSDDPRSFTNKPILTRIAVVTAGVVFNAISALMVFIIVFLVGINLTPPLVGGVLSNSPAEVAGIRPGDRIIQINRNGNTEYVDVLRDNKMIQFIRNTNLDFSNISIAAALSDRDEAVRLKVQHENGSVEEVSIVSSPSTETGLRLFGIAKPATLTIEKVSKPEVMFDATGLKPGDEIVAADGKKVEKSWHLEKIVRNHLKPTISLSINRREPGPSEKQSQIRSLQTQLELSTLPTNYNFQTEYELAHIHSIVPRLRIAEVQQSRRPSYLERLLALLRVSGCRSRHIPLPLKRGDIITAVGDVKLPTFTELRTVTTEHEGSQMSISILRADENGDYKPLTMKVTPRRPPGSDRVRIGIMTALDAENPVLATTIDARNGPKALHIPRGARITRADGKTVSSFYDLVEIIRQSSGRQIELEWQKSDPSQAAESGNEPGAGTAIIDVQAENDYITVHSVFTEMIPFKELRELYKASGPINAIEMGSKKTMMFIVQAYATIKGLFARFISPKTLVGPLGIFKLTYTIVTEQPLSYYFYFLGMISAIIAVMNFLPLPILDGGLVVLLLVEKLKGSPISTRAQAVLTYAGLAFIAVLFLYVTRNDIINFFLN